MSFINDVKDVVSVVQKADNVDLYKKLLDIYKEALEMQEEISRLKEENKLLKKQDDISENVERYQHTYITLKNDNKKLIYCATCWDNEKSLVQMRYFNEKHVCNKCRNYVSVQHISVEGK